MSPDVHEHLPLSPATLHVLLALTPGELHGYGIMLQVARQSGGQYKIGPGTLYDNLKKLLLQGLVEHADANDAERRRYRLTDAGTEVLRAEVKRLDALLREARRALRLTERPQ